MKHQPIFSCWICKGHPLPGSHLEIKDATSAFILASHKVLLIFNTDPPNLSHSQLCTHLFVPLVLVSVRLKKIILYFERRRTQYFHWKTRGRKKILSIPESMGMVALCFQSTADYKAPCRSCVRGGCKFWLLLKSKQHFTCAFPLVFETPLTLSSSPFSSCPRWWSSPWWWRSPGRASPWCPAHRRHSPSWRCVCVFLKQTSLIPVNCNFHILIFRHQHLFYSLESVPVQHLLHLIESCPLIIL